MTERLKEAVENFKDYTSGHGYVLRTLAEQVLQASECLPEKVENEHSCEFDCKGCVSSGWNQAIDLCTLAITKNYIHKSKLLGKMEISKEVQECIKTIGIENMHLEQIGTSIAQAITEAQLKKMGGE